MEPDPAFDEKMHQLLLSHPIARSGRRRGRRLWQGLAAAAVLVLALCVVPLFKNRGPVPLREVHWEWLPENAEVIRLPEEIDPPNQIITVVSTEATLLLKIGPISGNTQIDPSAPFGKETETQQFQAGDKTVEAVLGVNDIFNSYFWTDEKNDLFFSMISDLSNTVNLKVLEGIGY